MSAKPLVVLLILGSVWGASFLFIKVVVDEISPLELVTWRLLLGALALLPVLAYRRAGFDGGLSMLAKVAVLALFANILPFTLIAWAETRIESGVTSVLNSTMPIFTALFAAAILAEERFTAGRLAGLVAGFVGVVLLAGGDVLDVTNSNTLGQLAVVGAAACYGAGAVYLRILLRAEDPLTLSGLQLILGTLIAAPLMLAVEGTPELAISAKAWLSLLALGVVGSGFAFVAYLWLVDNLGSVRSSLVTYVIPVVGLLLGWAVLDEGIGVNTLAGGAFIILGVAAIMRGEAPTSERASAPSPPA